MKDLLTSLSVALVLFAAGDALAQSNLEKDPGYLAIDKTIDLKTVRPEVNVNLPQFLLKDAAESLNGGPDDPFAGTGIKFADLIKDIKLIRVVVIEAGKTNRSLLDKGIAALRAELDSKWTAVVTVPEDNVGVYVRSGDSGESMAGLAVLVNDDGDAVIANVVGRVSLGKILKIAAHFDKLPKDLLKKLAAPAAELEGKADRPTEPAPSASHSNP